MPRFTQNDADCVVYTFKEGLLSAMAHDLEIRVERFHVEWDDARTRIEARFEPTSLRVVHAMKDGAPHPGALSDRDKRKIESNIEADVLETRRHPEIHFVSSGLEALPPGSSGGDGFLVHGMLELHGRSRAVRVSVEREQGAGGQGERWVATATLHQPDFGITPYSAMMGTLRIQPDVKVRLSTPA
jgi:hypothetical protein